MSTTSLWLKYFLIEKEEELTLYPIIYCLLIFQLLELQWSLRCDTLCWYSIPPSKLTSARIISFPYSWNSKRKTNIWKLNNRKLLMYRICMAYDHFVFPPLSNWWLDEHLKGSEIHIFDLEYPDSLLWNEKKDASKSTVYLEIELFSSAHTKEDLPSLSCQLLPRGCCLTVPRAHRCDNSRKSCIIHMCSSGGTDGLFPASHTRHNWDLIVGYRLARLFYLLLQYCNWLDIMQKSWEPQLSISTKLHTIYINRWVVTFGDQRQ